MTSLSKGGVPTFYPTMGEMKDFSKYIEQIEKDYAHKIGLAKIVPPREWKPRKNGYNDVSKIVIDTPIEQQFIGQDGVYYWVQNPRDKMTTQEFREICYKYRATPEHSNYDQLEEIYWQTITKEKVIYGADVNGSLYDKDCDEFNITRLGTCLQIVSNDLNLKIDGVTSPYLYFGMWKSTFAWHTEDMDLYSINYLHFGCPKSWYVIPPQYGHRFEQLAAKLFPEVAKKCPAFLRHKVCLISPEVLKRENIPFFKTTQEKEQFIITFPYAYHSGYNQGFNCAESTNFALPRWIEYGKRAKPCLCGNTTIILNMAPYVERYQPQLLADFYLYRDRKPHPETFFDVLAKPISPTELKASKQKPAGRFKKKRKLDSKSDSKSDSQ